MRRQKDICQVSVLLPPIPSEFSVRLFYGGILTLVLFKIFLASILSAILYSLIFLVLRGTLVIRGGLKINLDPHERWNGRIASGEEYHRFMASVARSMLWYDQYII